MATHCTVVRLLSAISSKGPGQFPAQTYLKFKPIDVILLVYIKKYNVPKSRSLQSLAGWHSGTNRPGCSYVRPQFGRPTLLFSSTLFLCAAGITLHITNKWIEGAGYVSLLFKPLPSRHSRCTYEASSRIGKRHSTKHTKKRWNSWPNGRMAKI